MFPQVLLILAVLAGADDIPERMATLEEHFQALTRIEVRAERQDEKTRKLEDLKAQLDAGASDAVKVNDLYRAMDAVRTWLWENAVLQPERAPGGFEETPEAWTVTTPSATFSVNRSDLSMELVTPKATWRYAACYEPDIRYNGQLFSLRAAETQTGVAFHTGYAPGMRMVLQDFPDAPGLVLYLTVYVKENELVFDLAADEVEAKLEDINWPKNLELPASENALTLCTTMQGALVPGNWHQEIIYDGLTNSRQFTMPWWGHIVDGNGVLVILETPDDAGGTCVHHPGGPTYFTPKWYASLGKLRYLRTIRYIFQDDATYVTLAKRYRQYVVEKGRFVSLEQKCVRTPILRTLLGSPYVHTWSMYHYVPAASFYKQEKLEQNHILMPFERVGESLRLIKDAGIEGAYVHIDGWGFYGYDSAHPDPLPPGYEQRGWEGLRRLADTCRELGYFFTLHDQYRDFYLNSVSFDDRLAATNTDGTRFEVSQWCGGPQTVLSARYAPEYVRRNYDMFRDHGIPVQGSYLDVFSILPYDESAQPGCPMTRTECAQYRQECFDLLHARGMVVTSEEASDRYTGSLDMVKHCPYPKHPHIWAGEEAFGIPTPIFNLVYHDSIITRWNLISLGAWGIPPGTSGLLHCLLNAGTPWQLVPWEKGDLDPAYIATVQQAAELGAKCAFAEMVNHEFLNPEKTRQRATYSNGVQVTVDFATDDYEVHPGLAM